MTKLKNTMEIYSKINELISKNQPFTQVTVVNVKGSAPGKVGFKMLVESSGQIYGTIGGGAIEKHVIEEALNRLSTGENGLKEYLLSNKAREEEAEKGVTIIPMTCSGRVSLFYEVQGNRPTAYVFGGGHVGQALLHQLSFLGFHSILIDNRPDFANKDKNPHATEVVFSDYVEYAQKFEPSHNSFIVLVTHGHKHDFSILDTIYKRKLQLPYIGIIASKTKAAGLFKELKASHGDAVDTSPIHSPIGLNIGGTSANEIALAIAAEIQSVRYKKIND